MFDSYSEDGDFEGSKFSAAYGIGFCDEGCVEVEYLEKSSKDLRVLLNGFSYDDIIIPRFFDLVGELANECNAVVLFYNVSYTGNAKEWPMETGLLRFIGTVAYAGTKNADTSQKM